MIRFFRYSGALEFTIDFKKAKMWCRAAAPLPGVNFKKKPQAGEKRYNWEDKIIIALDYSEVALISQACKDAREGFLDWEMSIFHDAAKSSVAKMKTKKSLALSQSDGKTWLNFNSGPIKIGFALSDQELYKIEIIFAQAAYDLALAQQELDQLKIQQMREEDEWDDGEQFHDIMGDWL